MGNQWNDVLGQEFSHGELVSASSWYNIHDSNFTFQSICIELHVLDNSEPDKTSDWHCEFFLNVIVSPVFNGGGLLEHVSSVVKMLPLLN
jgi:hypothetical protein